MLQYNEKAMELLKELVNITGMYDREDTFPAAAVIQNMALEIHMTSRVGTSEILSRLTSRFTKNVVDHHGTELRVQDFQTGRNLLDGPSTNGSQANTRMLLTRLSECMQVAVQMNALPCYANPQRYITLIAGIVEISKMEHENSQVGYSKKLRFLLASFMREFEHTKKLQQETAALTISGVARPLFTQTFPAQANAAGLARQGQALCDSTNAQRQGNEEGGGWRYNKKINKRQRTRIEERPGHISIIKHSGASNRFEQVDRHG